MSEVMSFNAQLRAMRRGETIAKAKRLVLGEQEAGDINDVLNAMRRTINSAVSKTRDATGSNFRVESGPLITADNEAILAVVTVSRI